jgi:creatinine amidohydrolase/Fe(II)-dependent formamide hydrolase-like protein
MGVTHHASMRVYQIVASRESFMTKFQLIVVNCHLSHISTLKMPLKLTAFHVRRKMIELRCYSVLDTVLWGPILK